MPIASIKVAGVIVPNNPRKIRDDEVAEYRANGWQITPDEVITEAAEMSSPVIAPVEQTPLEKLEVEVEKVIGKIELKPATGIVRTTIIEPKKQRGRPRR